jgi:voltage-gated potassium channel
VGKNVVHELTSERLPFVVIDSDPAKVAHLHDLGHLALPGNAADEHLLQEARIDRARGLVVCASSDAENVYIVLTARGLRADIPIVARANYEESEAKLRRAGADRVILPFTIAGHRMVSLLVRPEAADFMDEALRVGGTDLLLEQINLAADSVLANKTLAQSELGSRFGVTVLACRQPDGKLETRPGAETILQPEARLIVLGTSDQLRALIELAHGSGARR